MTTPLKSISNDNVNISIETDMMSPQKKLWSAYSNKDLKEFSAALEMGADPFAKNDDNISVFQTMLYPAIWDSNDCKDFIAAVLEKGHIPSCTEHPILVDEIIRYAFFEGDRGIIEAMFNPQVARMCEFMPLSNSLDLIRQKEPFADNADHEGFPLLGNDATQKQMEDPENSIIHRLYLQNQESLPDMTCENLDRFIEQFHSAELTDEQKLILLIKSIVERNNQVFDFLMKHGVDYNAHLGECNVVDIAYWDLIGHFSPLYFAILFHNGYALKKLLEKDDLKTDAVKNPLNYFYWQREWKKSYGDYDECIKVFLTSSRFDVNAMRQWGIKIIHQAASNNLIGLQKKLLNCGTYIGYGNITHLSPHVLLEHFNSCITWDTFEKRTTDFYVNYQNLIPPPDQDESQDQRVMPPLVAFSKSENHRHLLSHPVIESFLLYKWHQLSVMFYVNFLLYLFFAGSIMTFITLEFGTGEVGSTTVTVFRALSWLGIFYMVIRESLQMFTSFSKYVRSFTNYMELLMIVLAIVSCSGIPGIDLKTQRGIAACTLLLVAWESFLLFGNLPILSMSSHMRMLQVVGRNFLKTFGLYSIFVVTFCLCFHILFGHVEVMSVDDNKFINPMDTIVKIMVMLTGEFDAGSLEFPSIFSYMIFLIFIFVMPMVLYNLLNGLAVSDIQAVRDIADLNANINRTLVLSKYEDVFNSYSKYFKWISRVGLFISTLDHNCYKVEIFVNVSGGCGYCFGLDEKGFHLFKHFPTLNSRLLKKIFDVIEDNTKNLKADNSENNIKLIDKVLEEVEGMKKTLCEIVNILNTNRNDQSK